MDCLHPVFLNGAKFNCGKCINCRKMKSLELKMRLYHESLYHSSSVFCTFTYNDERLPLNPQGIPTLRKNDFQLFMKRLRKAFGKIRVFYCGEYGGETNRPHYHAVLFGISERHKDLIQKEWNLGFISVSNLTIGRCGYVAKYMLKNAVFSKEYCLEHNIEPQFVQSSNKPGIGYLYVQENYQDVLKDLSVLFCGKKRPIPRYYYNKLKELDEFLPQKLSIKNFEHTVKELKLDPLKPIRLDRFKEQSRLAQLELNKTKELQLKGV